MKTHPSSVFAVVLAGGSGTRFWPRSRQASPKQLCKITNPNETMLEQTLHRLDHFIAPDKRMIITHHSQEKKTRLLTQSLCQHLLAEPAAKNTAAALALAALEIKLLTDDENTLMISLHSDHVIQDSKAFQKTLEHALTLADQGYLTLVGIPPRSPETGFGYIQRGERVKTQDSYEAFHVRSFKEKPKEAQAREYVQSKNYDWNSGIFVWKLKTICSEFEERLPQIWKPLFELYKKQKLQKKTFADLDASTLSEVYKALPEIAIDHGILEKSSNCVVIPGDFGWNDVGTWTALTEVLEADASGNITQGDTLLCETKNSIIASDGPFVASYGIENLIVVVENGCVLICPKDKAQGIKDIVAQLKERGRNDLV